MGADTEQEALKTALLAIGRVGSIEPSVLLEHQELLRCVRLSHVKAADRAVAARDELLSAIAVLPNHKLRSAAEVAFGIAEGHDGLSVTDRMRRLELMEGGYSPDTFKRRRRRALDYIVSYLDTPEPAPPAGESEEARVLLDELLEAVAELHHATLVSAFVVSHEPYSRVRDSFSTDSRNEIVNPVCAEYVFNSYLLLISLWGGDKPKASPHLAYYMTDSKLDLLLSALDELIEIGPKFYTGRSSAIEANYGLRYKYSDRKLAWLYDTTWSWWWRDHHASRLSRVQDQTRLALDVLSAHVDRPDAALAYARDRAQGVLRQYYGVAAVWEPPCNDRHLREYVEYYFDTGTVLDPDG